MSTEELKMVMDALSSLGANGKEAFIWWMVISYGSRLVIGLMVLCAAIGIPYVITRCIAAHSARGRALQVIGERLGVDYLPWREYTPPGTRIEDVVAAFNAKHGS